MDRIFALRVKAEAECRNVACPKVAGYDRPEECGAEECGELLMSEGFRTELRAMRIAKDLILSIEAKELAAAAAEAKKGGRR